MNIQNETHLGWSGSVTSDGAMEQISYRAIALWTSSFTVVFYRHSSWKRHPKNVNKLRYVGVWKVFPLGILDLQSGRAVSLIRALVTLEAEWQCVDESICLVKSSCVSCPCTKKENLDNEP